MSQSRSFARQLPRLPKWKRAFWQLEAAARRLSRNLVKAENTVPRPFDAENVRLLSAHTEVCFRRVEHEFPVGSLQRSRQILQIIGEGYPTPALTDAYFSNLDLLLAEKDELCTPGELVIGMGTGRSGSTSLAAQLGTIENSCSTHENPPLVFWSPTPDQVSFHLRRLAKMVRYHALVADCAHWWINLVDDLVHEFPAVKFIGLTRDKWECMVSFARVKGLGRGTFNHWTRHPNDIWLSTVWDPTYPTFETPTWAERSPDRAKWEMIEQYLDLYECKMESAAARFKERFLLLEMESLNDLATISRLHRFVGVSSNSKTEALRLNVRSTKDGRLEAFKI